MQIWAEAGQCEGDINYAFEAVDAVAEAGGDALKVQVLRPELIASPTAVRYDAWGNGLLQRDAFDKYLDYDAWGQVAERCRQRGLGFIPAVFDEEAARYMADVGDSVKIASGDITNRPLIEAAVQEGKGRLVLSTGGSTEKEIVEAVSWVRKMRKNVELVLLACHLQYPTQIADAHLGRVLALGHLMATRGWTSDTVLGYSDHTPGTAITPLLVAMGVAVQEKHFTLKGKGHGGDHEFAVTPAELRDMSNARDGIVTMFGDVDLEPSLGEMAARVGARRSIHALRDMAAGEKITRENTAPLRPFVEGAVQPAEWDEIMRFGAVVTTAVKAGSPILRGGNGTGGAEEKPPTSSGRGKATATLTVE